MHIILDGYNFIRQSPELVELDRKDLEWGRDALIDLLAAYKKIKRHRITVVFDGANEPSLYGSRDRSKGIAIHFSHGGETADDVIRRMARKEGSKALVVSSYREVMNAAEAAGAAVLGSLAFEEKLSMARYVGVKGGEEPDASSGWIPTTRKKGPSRRLSKKKRKAQARIKKL